VALVDLDAVRANTERLRAAAGGRPVMAVVKADGYGHGLLPSARAALAGGAAWLGVAHLDEGVALRDAGIDAPILGWIAVPGDPVWAAAVGRGIDVSASAIWAVDEAVAAATATGRVARLHLKVDTGLGRAGAPAADWPALVGHALAAQAAGAVEVVGVWSHLAYADEPGHPTVAAQIRTFGEAAEAAAALGLRGPIRHLANSAATLAAPEAHFDLVRPGIALYGLSPGPLVGTPASLGLRPAMTLQARLSSVKRVPGGHGVSYAHAYTTARETTLGLVPLGYADGIGRAAGNAGPVLAAGRLRRVAGRVCMDQFVLDLGDDPAEAGDPVVLFGPGDAGEPTAEDWAQAMGTIGYEVVTRIGPRVPRRYVGSAQVGGLP
jgi:alanine racemase